MKNSPPNPSHRRRLTRHAVLWGACAFLPSIASAQLYWRTDGTSGNWTAENWSNPASATGGTTWTSGSDAVFTENSTLTFETTAVGNVTVSANKTVSVSSPQTLTLGGVRTFDIGAGATLNWTSQTQSSAAGNEGAGIIKNGAGNLNWGAGPGSNTRFNGGFTLNAGTVIATGAYSFGSGAMAINGGTIETSKGLTFTPTTLSVGGDFQFTSTGSSTAEDIWSMPVSLNGGTRTITQNASGNRVFSGEISNGGLIKAGSGVLTLSGANTYAGKTTVSSGTLVLGGGGSIETSAEIEVANGANLDVSAAAWTLKSGQKLMGSGTVSGAVTIDGTHAPGTAGTAGTQTINGGLAYDTGSIFEWELNALESDPGVASNSGVYDKLTSTGSITGSSGIFKIVLDTGDSFAEAFWNTNKSWTNIFTGGMGSGTLASIFSSFGGAGIVSETVEDQLRGTVTDQGYFSFDGGSLNFTAVPEPSSAVAGLLLGAGLLRRRRR